MKPKQNSLRYSLQVFVKPTDPLATKNYAKCSGKGTFRTELWKRQSAAHVLPAEINDAWLEARRAIVDIITDAIKSGDYELVKETNRKVASLIEQYPRSHSVIDASIGIMGWLPVPGASLASFATSFATQIPVIKSLVFEIGRLYRPSETHNLAVET